MFSLTEDHIAVRDMARAFADERIAPNALAWDEAKHFPVDVLREAAALGMATIYVGEQHGGAGMTRLHAALIFEALATGCPTVAAYLSIHNMVAWVIDRFGSSQLQAHYLPKLALMELLSSYCLTEPGAGSDAAALATRARREGYYFVLDGVKQFISGAGATDLYLVMARTGDQSAAGVSAFLVEKGTPGLSFGANERKMGWNAQPTRQVILEGVRVSADAMVGKEGDGFKIAMAGLDGGRLNIGACSLGGGEAALAKAVAYMNERKAFGRRIADFQALQFKVADIATSLETARTMLWRAASALDARAPDSTRLCAMAKRVATDAGFAAANDALQLFGGYGYLAEYGIEKIVRDLRVHQILEGTNEIMRVIIARGLLQA
ncbi:MAG: acyl-CoA dehydrogenase family protein [Hyphomicrobiales bacterium]|nr:acyl-CoA dehydrogenase family protein [Hyphomicrobiales bacterium]